MELTMALQWYREDRFTAEDVTRATGLSERAQRELLKLGILSAVTQANPKAQRLLDATMVKRAAVIGPLNRAGLSLGVAGKIVLAATMLEDLIYHTVDPLSADPSSEFYDERAAVLFAPTASPTQRPGDYQISIFDVHFVKTGRQDGGGFIGELSEDQTDFIWWDHLIYDHIKSAVADGMLRLSVKGIADHHPEDMGGTFNSETSKVVEFSVRRAPIDIREALDHVQQNPLSLLTINASLALRLALRRLLYLKV